MPASAVACLKQFRKLERLLQLSYEDKRDGWRWRFAFFPFRLDNGPKRTWVWLEWYQARFMGLYVEVRLCQKT